LGDLISDLLIELVPSICNFLFLLAQGFFALFNLLIFLREFPLILFARRLDQRRSKRFRQRNLGLAFRTGDGGFSQCVHVNLQ
jgi:hypothetical protein